jgi:hypothetical protein
MSVVTGNWIKCVDIGLNVWISVGSALMTRSLLIWQLAFPKGLGAAVGRPRVAPSTPVIFDVI